MRIPLERPSFRVEPARFVSRVIQCHESGVERTKPLGLQLAASRFHAGCFFSDERRTTSIQLNLLTKKLQGRGEHDAGPPFGCRQYLRLASEGFASRLEIDPNTLEDTRKRRAFVSSSRRTDSSKSTWNPPNNESEVMNSGSLAAVVRLEDLLEG